MNFKSDSSQMTIWNVRKGSLKLHLFANNNMGFCRNCRDNAFSLTLPIVDDVGEWALYAGHGSIHMQNMVEMQLDVFFNPQILEHYCLRLWTELSHWDLRRLWSACQMTQLNWNLSHFFGLPKTRFAQWLHPHCKTTDTHTHFAVALCESDRVESVTRSIAQNNTNLHL